MRTTVTLEPDVARLLDEQAHREGKPFEQVVDEAIRRGVAQATLPTTPSRFRVQPHKTTLRPGIDAGSLNRLADEIEDDAIVEKLRPGR